MKKVLVTGATGLVGSHLVPRLVEQYQVHAVVRREPSVGVAGVEYINLDLGQGCDFSSLPEEIDAVVYLAQSENFRSFPEKATDIFSVNTTQVLNLIDYARRAGARSFVFASTGGVYGNSKEAFSETTKIEASADKGFYTSTKLCSEILLEAFADHLNVVILRFFFVYGQGQKRTMLLPRLFDNVKAGKVVNLQGQDGLRINPTHVSDAVCAVESSLGLEGFHKINVAGPEVLSLREICDQLGAYLGVAPVYDLDRESKPRHLIADISRMRSVLHKPTRLFRDGLKELAPL